MVYVMTVAGEVEGGHRAGNRASVVYKQAAKLGTERSSLAF